MAGKLRGKVAMLSLLLLSVLLAFPPVSDSQFLLFRPIRTHATHFNKNITMNPTTRYNKYMLIQVFKNINGLKV